jgi:toxin ParE1/3/4
MRLIFAPLAEQDLKEILNYIAQDKPLAAQQFVKRQRSACERLSSHLLLGQQCPEFPNRGYRRTSVGHFAIYYEVRPSEVAILRIVHGSRDIGRIFGES